jgi:NADH:ubiquinone oxidoreductase subunit F (NADH-binding)
MRAGAYRELEPRLVHPGVGGREDLEGYAQARGSAPGIEGAALIDAVEASGLRGRGGAGFPAGVKWRAVAQRPGPRFVVANGAEAEPTSWKDRYLLRMRPHLVLDGLLRASCAVGAEGASVYLCDRQAAASVRAALGELPAGPLPVRVVTVPPAYVAGEETAVVRAVNGGVAKPTTKPPRPFEAGVQGRPTLVTNVETLANIPFISAAGPEAFRRAGTRTSPGTFLFTASGVCRRPGVYELPLGITVREAFDVAAGFTSEPAGFVMGGYFAGLLNRRGLDLPLDFDVLRSAGSGLGCGAVMAFGADRCAVGVAAGVMGFFARESSGQCGVCVRGTAAMRDALESLATGHHDEQAIGNLRRWSTGLRGRGACALLDGAATLAASLLNEFPDAVERHLTGTCPVCPGDHRPGGPESGGEGGAP